MSNAEITALFGNIQEIVTFQRQFLQNLEEALELEPDFNKFDHSSQFKVLAHLQPTGSMKWCLISNNLSISECFIFDWISVFVLRQPF